MSTFFRNHLTFIIFLFPGYVFSQHHWQWINPEITNNYIYDIEISKYTNEIFASTDNEILRSSDGNIWHRHLTNIHFSNISVINDSLTFGFSSLDRKLYKNIFSNNPIAVFELTEEEFEINKLILNPETGKGLAVGGYVIHIPSTYGYILANHSIILQTSDFGENWQIEYNERGNKLDGLVSTNEGYFSYGEEYFANYILKSDKDGRNWSEFTESGLPTHRLKNLIAINDSLQLASHTKNEVLYVLKNGIIQDELNTFELIIDHVAVNDSVIVVTTRNRMHISKDLGLTWEEISRFPTYKHSKDLEFVNSKIAALMGSSGEILLTDPDVDTIKFFNKTLMDLFYDDDEIYISYDVKFVFTSEKIGYGAITDWHYNNALIKTTDGGCSWEIVSTIPLYSQVKKLVFLNDSVGFAHGGVSGSVPSSILKTTDGGLSWTKSKVNGYAAFMNTFTFLSDKIGIGMNRYDVIRTTDGGLNWVETNNFYPEGPNQLFPINDKIVYGAGSYDYFLKSIDAGETWSKHKVGFDLKWESLYFFNADVGFMVGSKFVFDGTTQHYTNYMIKTTDGGNSWNVVLELPNPPKFIDFQNSKIGFLLLKDSLLYKTFDGGSQWTQEHIPAQDLDRIYNFGETIYIKGNSSQLLKSVSKPVAEFTPDDYYCQEDTIIISNLSQRATEYKWQLGNKFISTDKQFNQSIREPGIYKLTLYSGTCNMGVYDSFETEIEVKPSPDPPQFTINEMIASEVNNLCDSTYTVSTVENHSSYLWPDESNSPTYKLLDENFLFVTLTNEYGCTVTSDTINFRWHGLVEAGFEYKYTDSIGYIYFKNLSKNAEYYHWDFGNGQLSEETNPIHYYGIDESKEFIVELKASNFCYSDSVNINFKLITATDNTYPVELYIYPNPAKSYSFVTVKGERNNLSYSIIDLGGKIITPISKINDQVIFLSSIEEGIYILQLYNNNQFEQSIKLIVTNSYK